MAPGFAAWKPAERRTMTRCVNVSRRLRKVTLHFPRRLRLTGPGTASTGSGIRSTSELLNLARGTGHYQQVIRQDNPVRRRVLKLFTGVYHDI
jgi:hypothetical protein